MADIDIVPKHRSRTWLWVVLALVIIALLIWMMSARNGTPGASLLNGSGVHLVQVSPVQLLTTL